MAKKTDNKKAAGKSAAKNKVNNLTPKVSVKGDLVTVTIKFKNDKNGGHNHVIVDSIDDNHVSVGLSTKPKKGKTATNYKLEMSPFPDGKQSFMRRQGTVAPKQSYTSPRKGKMTKKNHERAVQYGQKAKQKYIDKKQCKKK